MTESILKLKNLTVDYEKKHHPKKQLIRHIDLDIPKGKIVGIVGESGSGKSISMKAAMSLLPDYLKTHADLFEFAGTPVEFGDHLPIAMIFQDPMTALNPLRTIGYHLTEVIARFQKVKGAKAKALAITELQNVGIPFPEKRLKQYPHELSGGMRQRVMIAMAFLAQPQFLIADEPTTALDVTIQAQILYLIRKLQQETNLSVVLVTHDFGVVAGMSEFIKVMYQGKIVEEGTTEEIFYNPQHEYTKKLLKASTIGRKGESLYSLQAEKLIIADNLVKHELSETHHVWLEGENNE
ncbi:MULTISPECIES: ABC transporter ATP-binding protein [Enterococcus]|uniref:ABC transporter ATP-binding protein n=1 Tax=Enterococcus TaxID=1350 RepID=UPI0010F69C34|nr:MULTISPECIES: ABC transporter ATP-binding protein [Enterococcus]KAF1301753.1 peptide ABC transporter [Enterococcus sp. JM9B]